MQKLGEILDQQRRLRAQAREIRGLREEIRKLEQQNIRMREGMRRCVSCDYRIEVVARREAEGS
jgi:uncharacterized protein with PIN domain